MNGRGNPAYMLRTAGPSTADSGLVGRLQTQERDSAMSIRIVLADDHAVLRDGLRQAFQQEEGMEIVGQASDGQSAVERARELKPDIVVMDINMPNLNGIEATREIQREAPGVRVIALSMHSAKPCVKEIYRAGRTYVSPSISDVVVGDFMRAEETTAPTAFSLLTAREREIVQLLAEGGTIKQIALRLHISPKTVEAHRLRVMNKLQIDTMAQLTKYAIQEGLTSAEI
jgi:two-component system response regulator NreC